MHHHHRLLTLAALCMCTGTGTILAAGDLITDRKGNSTAATVLRVLPATVEYKKLSNPDGPVYIANRCELAEITYANGERDVFTETCAEKPVASGTATPANYARFAASIEPLFGAFGLFNVDNVFTKSTYSFGATPSFMVRLHRNVAAGVECMLLWGQAESADPLRFIINPNLRGEVLFPINSRLTLELIAAAGFSIWPVMDTVGVIDSTFFNQRGGWNARAAFGAEWQLNPTLSLLCNIGYSASSSESADVWITHDMMMVHAGVRWLVGKAMFGKK